MNIFNFWLHRVSNLAFFVNRYVQVISCLAGRRKGDGRFWGSDSVLAFYFSFETLLAQFFVMTLHIKYMERFSFERRKVIGFASTTLRYGLKKNSRHFFVQSEVKPKPSVTHRHSFSRAIRQLHVIYSRFDWFPVVSVSFVIGWSDYFGSGFTTLNWKPL